MLLLADTVLVLHLLFVAFVILGGALVLRWPRAAFIHGPVALWGAGISLGGWICPLTPLENWLRQGGGGAAYGTGFIEHYVVPVLYPLNLTREVQMAAGLLLLTFNVALYAVAFRRRRIRPDARG